MLVVAEPVAWVLSDMLTRVEGGWCMRTVDENFAENQHAYIIRPSWEKVVKGEYCYDSDFPNILPTTSAHSDHFRISSKTSKFTYLRIFFLLFRFSLFIMQHYAQLCFHVTPHPICHSAFYYCTLVSLVTFVRLHYYCATVSRYSSI